MTQDGPVPKDLAYPEWAFFFFFVKNRNTPWELRLLEAPGGALGAPVTVPEDGAEALRVSQRVGLLHCKREGQAESTASGRDLTLCPTTFPDLFQVGSIFGARHPVQGQTVLSWFLWI